MQRRLLLLVTALFLASPWRAACDPAKEDPLGDDPKLDKRVTISAEGVPVGELLVGVSKKVGLALRADAGVADDKVIIFGPPRPLKAILMDIAALYNDSWRHYTNVEGKEQYVLYREPRAMRYEDGLANAVVAKMQAQLEEQVRALEETPEQFAKRPEKDRIRQNFAKSILHGRTATRLYGLLDRQQKDTLFAQGYLNVSFTDSRATDQETVRSAFKEAVAALEKENERIQQENPDVHIVIDAPENLARHGIRFNLHHENNAGLSAMVVQVIMGKASYMTMGEFDSAMQWILPPHGDPYTGKPVAKDAELPKDKDATAAGKMAGWIDPLRVLAERSERPVVADYYRSPALVKPLPTDEAAGMSAPEKAEPIATDETAATSASTQASSTAALDTLCHPTGYLWWVRDKTLLFRKRDWYRQRLYEVPDRWIRSVAKGLKQNKGVPNYGDLTSLLELSRTQMAGLNNLFAGGGGTPDDADSLAGVPELLQLIRATADPAKPIYTGSLTPEIIAQIGLPANGPAPAVRPSVASFLAARRQITAPADVVRFRVCLTCYGPLPASKQEEPSPDPRGKVTLVVEWNPDEGQTPYDQRLQLYLPTELPDDRSGKTKVEVEL